MIRGKMPEVIIKLALRHLHHAEEKLFFVNIVQVT